MIRLDNRDLVTVEKTMTARTLVSYYNRYSDNYDGGYPEVLNPSALMSGITNVAKKMSDGELPDLLLLYVIEDEQDERNPREAQYVIALATDNGRSRLDELPNAFALRLFYSKTQEMESQSIIDESRVYWSLDDMTNTKHPQRTKYYLGFTYLLCSNSPGFDIIPVPEKVLTGIQLIEADVEGEIPPEIIEVPAMDELIASEGETVEETLEQPAAAEDYTPRVPARRRPQKTVEEQPRMVEDDTEVKFEEEDLFEDEYDDLETDYEELFD